MLGLPRPRHQGGRGGKRRELIDYAAFRLHFNRLTEAECRACRISGGTVVEDEKEREAYRKALKRDDIEVGDELYEEPPCKVTEAMLETCEKEGRPCPRVELSAENGLPAQLFWMSQSETSRNLMGPILDGLPPSERSTVAQRVASAIHDPKVQRALEFSRERAKHEEKTRTGR